MARLQDRVALVTGASSGIGNAIATAFGREGANVVVADIRQNPKLDSERSVFEKLEEAGADYRFVETDVSKKEEVENAVETAVDEFGGLDILVNNAGIYKMNPIHETSDEDWDETLEVNLTGIFYTCRAAIPYLQESNFAKIINLSSISGIVGSENSAAYCASKGGIANLTRQLALDYADDKINVNALAPGAIMTAMNAEWRENNPELVDEWGEVTPWPRLGEPEDIAHAAVFLASGESDFVTGQVISVDGGWSAH